MLQSVAFAASPSRSFFVLDAIVAFAVSQFAKNARLGAAFHPGEGGL